MKRRQEAAEEAERQRVQAEAGTTWRPNSLFTLQSDFTCNLINFTWQSILNLLNSNHKNF